MIRIIVEYGTDRYQTGGHQTLFPERQKPVYTNTWKKFQKK